MEPQDSRTAAVIPEKAAPFPVTIKTPFDGTKPKIIQPSF
jgi:hypothetical protein